MNISVSDLVSNLSLVTTKKYKGNQGQQQEKATWVSVTVYLRTAELLDMLTQQDTETFDTGSLVEDKWIEQRNQNRSKLGIAIVLSNIYRKPVKIVG